MELCRGHVGHVWLVWYVGLGCVNIGVNINVHRYNGVEILFVHTGGEVPHL